MLPIAIRISLYTISPLLAYLIAGLILLAPCIAGFSAVLGGLAPSSFKRLFWILVILLTGIPSAIVLAQNIYCYFTGLAFGFFLSLIFCFLSRHQKA